jgi:hypothetical protein
MATAGVIPVRTINGHQLLPGKQPDALYVGVLLEVFFVVDFLVPRSSRLRVEWKY